MLVQCRPEQQLLRDPGPHGTQSHSPPTVQYPHCTAPTLHSIQLSPSWPDQKKYHCIKLISNMKANDKKPSNQFVGNEVRIQKI